MRNIVIIFYSAFLHKKRGFFYRQILQRKPFWRKELGEFLWRCVQFAAKYFIPFSEPNPFHRFWNCYLENLFIMSSLFRIP